MRIIILLALFTSVCLGAESQFSTDKFTINAPAGSGDRQGVATIMYLPPKNGFAGNVNITIQEFAGTIEEYNELTQGQFKQAGITLVSSNINANSAKYEYMGKMGNFNLHWYARAISMDKKVILVTATGLEVDWNDQKDSLITSVDSFKMK